MEEEKNIFYRGDKYVPYFYHGGAYDIYDLIRNLVVSVERIRPTLKCVPYRNEMHMAKLKETFGEDVSGYKFRIPDELLVWRVIKRMPGALGLEPFSGIKERKPSFREAIPGEDGYILRFGWYIDSLVGVQIFARSHYEHTKLQKWFRNYLIEAAPVIRFLGAIKYFWLGCNLSDEFGYERPLNDYYEDLFFFRTEDIYEARESTMRSLEIDVGVDIDKKEIIKKYIDEYISNNIIINKLNN